MVGLVRGILYYEAADGPGETIQSGLAEPNCLARVDV
jgi:hypothetical protein